MHKQSTERNTFTGIYNRLGAMQGHQYEVLDILVDPPPPSYITATDVTSHLELGGPT